MCDPITLTWTAVALAGTAAAVSTVGAIQQGKAQSNYYKYAGDLAAQKAVQEGEITEKNVELTKTTAEQNRALIASETLAEEQQLKRDYNQLTGQQEAAIGKQGIGGVTAEDIVSSTFEKAKIDELAIKYNANTRAWAVDQDARNRVWGLNSQSARNIWGLQEEVKQSGFAARNARTAAKFQAAGTLLSTASSMASAGSLLKGGAGVGSGGGGQVPSTSSVRTRAVMF